MHSVFLLIHFSMLNLIYCRKLNDYISYYEPLEQVYLKPYPLVYGKPSQQQQQLTFHAFRRTFQLNLYPDTHRFHPNATISLVGERKTKNISWHDANLWIVEGTVNNETTSKVLGRLYQGQFEGLIRSFDTMYIVENSARYFKKRMPFRSIIYRRTDVNATEALCGKRGMCPKFVKLEGPIVEDDSNKRPKRETLTYHNNVCLVTMLADHTFYNSATDHTTDRVVNELKAILEGAEQVFETLIISEKNTVAVHIQFQIYSILIFYSTRSPDYKMYEESLTASQFLEQLSYYNFDDVCMGIAVTYRSFADQEMGICYQGENDPRRAGGICQKRRRALGSHDARNYNTALISVLSPDKLFVPRVISGLILAHELGHSFGSSHDDPKDKKCTPPFDWGGRYIMSPYILDNSEPNNARFSACSRMQIKQLIETKGLCFQRIQPICGNAIIENGEDCDCGNEEQCDDIDRCCTPAGGSGSNAGCHLRVSEGRVCSPKSSPCCSKKCSLIPEHYEKDCSIGNDCIYPARCSGLSPECPASNARPDGIYCRDGLGRCSNGICVDYSCAQKQLYSCDCLDIELDCQLCCRQRGKSECHPATFFGISKSDSRPFLRPAGELCQDARGKCNVAGKCELEFGAEKQHAVAAEKEAVEAYTQYSSERSTYERTFELLTILLISVVAIAIVGVTLVALFLFSPFGAVASGWNRR